LPKYTASVDAGNGGVNAAIGTKTKAGYKSYYEPSVRAAATGDSLGLGAQWEMQYSYADWNGHRYITGDDVTRVTKRALERHMGAGRYGNEFHQFLVAKALAELGVKSGTVDLTVFAPPGMYVEQREIILDRFGKLPAKIQLKGDSKPREWEYSNISVWPEGLGAAACFVIDEKGKPVKSDILTGDTVVLDLGAHTLDALKLSEGDFNPESLETATTEKGGVDVHIRQPIIRTLHKHAADFGNITVDDVDRVIRLGSVSGDYTIRAAGLEVDLKPLIDKHSERYAEWIANNICDGVFDGFKGIKSVILVGGGAYLVEDYIRDWYGDKLLDRKKSEVTNKLAPEDMNAVGGLRLALMRKYVKN